MKVGIAGMGKLGLPVGLAIESRGHEVYGYDVRPEPYEYIEKREIPYQEEGVPELLEKTNIKMVKELGELVVNSDIIFCPVQTPHEKRFEGATRLPEDRADFDYRYLTKAVKDIAETSRSIGKTTTLSVISTCLPGTYEREIKPVLNENIDYVYNPHFIAMGTTVKDYLNPEFVLCGTEDGQKHDKLSEFYESIHGEDKTFFTDITTAEGIKVFYNTIITAKTVLGNAMGEMSEKLGMDADTIYRALSKATDRIISPHYLKSGMSDGGGCHPRDNIALSYIAEKIGMSHNIWEDLMQAREAYEEWHADLAIETSKQSELPLIVLGKAFKPDTNIETGSPSVLMVNLIREKEYPVQHYEFPEEFQKAVYFIGTQHNRYRGFPFPKGSVVIDPFNYIPETPGIDIRRLGRSNMRE